jgi:hypothetical protein
MDRNSLAINLPAAAPSPFLWTPAAKSEDINAPPACTESQPAAVAAAPSSLRLAAAADLI